MKILRNNKFVFQVHFTASTLLSEKRLLRGDELNQSLHFRENTTQQWGGITHQALEMQVCYEKGHQGRQIAERSNRRNGFPLDF